MGRTTLTGTIARVLTEKGFGFIKSGQEEYFFHRSEVSAPLSFEALYKGQQVAFVPEEGPKGPRAAAVRPA